MEAPQERWPGLMTQALQRSGNDLATAAERAFREGRIGEADRRRVMATARALPATEAREDGGRLGRNSQ